ncbi:hypothetical protein EP7_000188 [Isosphaeraceae bacterium EP7]
MTPHRRMNPGIPGDQVRADPMFLVSFYFMKLIFFFSLVRAQAKFDFLSDRYFMLGILYVAGIAFLSGVFIMMPQPTPDWTLWQTWLGKTFLIATVYFWLMSRFSENLTVFFLLLFVGLGVVYY